MATSTLRIHPAIGIARVGNSQGYYIGPETMAGMPQPSGPQTGGLPIKAGTDDTPITSADIRDADGALNRQAARFKIFLYGEDDTGYPSGGGTEITLGGKIGERTVTQITWQSHLANKKANCWVLDDSYGVVDYENGSTPPLRNGNFHGSANPAARVRLEKLVIDAGPRTIVAEANRTPPVVDFNKETTPTFLSDDAVTEAGDYPVAFPDDNFETIVCPSGTGISTLGQLTVEAGTGRLLVLPGTGTACRWTDAENATPPSVPAIPFPNPQDNACQQSEVTQSDHESSLTADVNNDMWFDDTSDGPISAVLTFDDGTTRAVDSNAWVVCTDPAYAPQTLNVVSLWDDVYDTWVRDLDLIPDLYANGQFNPDYPARFDDEIKRVFRAASLQRWNTNLNSIGITAHDSVDSIEDGDAPDKHFDIMSFIRDPNNPEASETGPVLMPLSLGDATKSFLSVSLTQYFLLEQWSTGKSVPTAPVPLGPGEQLDRNVLVNCLGGRFSPGIDLTFIVRDPVLYDTTEGAAPFRMNAAPLDYSNASKAYPFLTVGYTPLHASTQVEPGDICKFMAIPWHTDYNSCATHLPAPNPGGQRPPTGIDDSPCPLDPIPYDGTNLTLYWSWPAQRPVAVYTFADFEAGGNTLPNQRFSVRGDGTQTARADKVGRFQNRIDMIDRWQDIGVVMQTTAIDGYEPDATTANYYLEVESRLDGTTDQVEPWPTTIAHPVQKES